MSFKIPNEADAGNTNQAEPDSVDFDILVAALIGTGVLDDCAVTPQGAPDTTVAVAAGTISVVGIDQAVAGGNVDCLAAHATLARFDLVVVDNGGVKSAVNGTAAANPVFPAIPANSVVLAAVYRAATDDAISAGEIVDKRVVIGGGQDLATDTLWAAQGDLVKGTGDDGADILSIGADHTVLVSDGSDPLWSAVPPLAGIADTGDTQRITIGTSTPNVLIPTGSNFQIEDGVEAMGIGVEGGSNYGLAMSGAGVSGNSTYRYINMAGGPTLVGVVVTGVSVNGNPTFTIPSSGVIVSIIESLNFQAKVSVPGGTPGNLSVNGAEVKPDVSGAASGNVINARGLLCTQPTYTGNMTIDLSQGIEIRNYGQSECTLSVAIDILAQSGSTTNRTIRALGTAPSIHQPALTIGANAAPATSAILELQSTAGALLLPRMSSAQEGALTAVNGMVIYNSDDDEFHFYENGAWVSGSGLA